MKQRKRRPLLVQVSHTRHKPASYQKQPKTDSVFSWLSVGRAGVSVLDVGYRQVGCVFSSVVVSDGVGAVESLGDVQSSLGISDPSLEFSVCTSRLPIPHGLSVQRTYFLLSIVTSSQIP